MPVGVVNSVDTGHIVVPARLRFCLGDLHMRHILSALMLIGLLTACHTPNHVADFRKGSDICDLHHTKMRSVQVPEGVGCVLPRAGYLEARDNLFPHSYPEWLESRKDFCLIYVCDDCIRAEDKWKKSH